MFHGSRDRVGVNQNETRINVDTAASLGLEWSFPTGGQIYSSPVVSGRVVYFGSDDIDADIAKVRELGGEADEKQPIPTVGWFARCKDTEGNPFSLFQSDESVAPPQ